MTIPSNIMKFRVCKNNENNKNDSMSLYVT